MVMGTDSNVKSAFVVSVLYSIRGERGGAATTDAEQRLQARREEILRLAAQHGARNVRRFGSAARGEAKASSDLDFLVEMEEGRSLLDLVGLWQDLEELLGCKVDVITDGGVSPYLRGTIYAEAVPL